MGSRSGRNNQSQGPESNIVIALFFRFCLPLRRCSFHLIWSDEVKSRISVLLPTPSVLFLVNRIALRFWLRLRLRHWWKSLELGALFPLFVLNFVPKEYLVIHVTPYESCGMTPFEPWQSPRHWVRPLRFFFHYAFHWKLKPFFLPDSDKATSATMN